MCSSISPTFQREPSHDGMITGSVGAFLVLEAEDKAMARGANIFARLSSVSANQTRRKQGDVTRSLLALGSAKTAALVVSAASGLAHAATEEKAALDVLAPLARLVAMGDLVGHSVEAAFPAAVALAAGMLAGGEASSALVTGVGHHRGEGIAHLSAV